MRFKDKVVVVTGAARGIGRGIALALASEGVHVAVADLGEARDPAVPYLLAGQSDLDETRRLLEAQGVRVAVLTGARRPPKARPAGTGDPGRALTRS